MKVFIITKEEAFFFPRMIRYISENQSNDYEIVGITILRPLLKNQTKKDWMSQRIGFYSIKDILVLGSLIFYARLIEKITQSKENRRYYSVRSYCKKAHIPVIETTSVNNEEYLEKIRVFEPDLLISMSSPELFGKNIISIPKYDCLNAHGTLLPKHRGVQGLWWTLFSGDKLGGATIHKVVLKVDAGEIVHQKQFKLSKEETQLSLAYKTNSLIAYAIVEVLRMYKNHKVNSHNMALSRGSYHYTPTNKEGRRFRRMKKKIVALKNVPQIIGKDLHVFSRSDCLTDTQFR